MGSSTHDLFRGTANSAYQHPQQWGLPHQLGLSSHTTGMHSTFYGGGSFTGGSFTLDNRNDPIPIVGVESPPAKTRTGAMVWLDDEVEEISAKGRASFEWH